MSTFIHLQPSPLIILTKVIKMKFKQVLLIISLIFQYETRHLIDRHKVKDMFKCLEHRREILFEEIYSYYQVFPLEMEMFLGK